MKNSINLMSDRAVAREATRRRLRQWASVLGLVVLVLAPIGGWRWWRTHRLARERAAATARYEPVRQMKSENAALAEEIETLRSTQGVQLALAAERPVLALVAVASSAVAEQGGVVFLRQLDVEQDPLAATDSEASRSSFVVEGAAYDARAVARLADALKEAAPLANVNVNTSDGRREGEGRLTAFTIRCAY